jgi:hypothetical protein
MRLRKKPTRRAKKQRRRIGAADVSGTGANEVHSGQEEGGAANARGVGEDPVRGEDRALPTAAEASQPPRAADPRPAEYVEPGAHGRDSQRVEGMSIDPKLENAAGASTRPRRE